MIYLLTRILPMKLVGLVVLAVVVFAATGGNLVGWFETQVLDAAVSAIEDWLRNNFTLW